MFKSNFVRDVSCYILLLLFWWVVLMSDSSTLNTNASSRQNDVFGSRRWEIKYVRQKSVCMINFVRDVFCFVVVVLMSWWVILWHWHTNVYLRLLLIKTTFSSMRDIMCETESVFMSNFVRDVFCFCCCCCCCCCFDEWFVDIEHDSSTLNTILRHWTHERTSRQTQNVPQSQDRKWIFWSDPMRQERAGTYLCKKKVSLIYPIQNHCHKRVETHPKQT